MFDVSGSMEGLPIEMAGSMPRSSPLFGNIMALHEKPKHRSLQKASDYGGEEEKAALQQQLRHSQLQQVVWTGNDSCLAASATTLLATAGNLDRKRKLSNTAVWQQQLQHSQLRPVV
jgi:hypothetical protein